MIQAVLDNQPGPAHNIVLLNAGAAIYVAGLAKTLQGGHRARAPGDRERRGEAEARRVRRLHAEAQELRRDHPRAHPRGEARRDRRGKEGALSHSHAGRRAPRQAPPPRDFVGALRAEDTRP